jgi:hypothetical protein
VAGEEYEKMMKEADLIYDMYAISGNQLDNININLEKINNSVLNNVVISSMLEETVPALKETYGNMGYTNIQTELSKVSIEGKEFTCLYVTGEINGLKMYQKLLPIKCNGYMANITITTYNQNTVDSLIENFYLVK